MALKVCVCSSIDAKNSNRRGRQEGPLPWFDIYHFRNEKGTRGEMSPAIVSGIVTGDAPVSYWPMFSPSQVTDPKIFAKVNSPHSEVANRDLKI